MEHEPNPKFSVTEMTEDMVQESTEMRLQSWLDTYVNEELGVTRAWVKERNAEQLSPARQSLRREKFKRGVEQGSMKAWVAIAENGKIIGSTTPYVDESGVQHVGSLYVDKKWHGTGVGGKLMQSVIDWFDDTKPIELNVASYNERAKAFYKKWGFEEVNGSEDLFDGKIPEIKMIRKGTNSDEV